MGEKKGLGGEPQPVAGGATPINRIAPGGEGRREYRGATPITVVNIAPNVPPGPGPGTTGPTPKPIVPVSPPPTKKK